MVFEGYVIHFQFREKQEWTCYICGAQNDKNDTRCHACGATTTTTKATTHEPDPIETEQSDVVLYQVLDNFRARAEEGKKKYGTYLKTHNGRDPLVDALQEAMDLVMYLTQAIMERDQGKK